MGALRWLRKEAEAEEWTGGTEVRVDVARNTRIWPFASVREMKDPRCLGKTIIIPSYH